MTQASSAWGGKVMLKTLSLMTEVAVDDSEETKARSAWGGKCMLKTVALMGEMAAESSDKPVEQKKTGGWGKMRTAALLGELAAESSSAPQLLHLEQAKQLFGRLDADASGKVTREEFLSGASGNSLCEGLDFSAAAGEDGQMSWPEFVAVLTAAGKLSEDEAKTYDLKMAQNAFCVMDADCSGSVSIAEFSAVKDDPAVASLTSSVDFASAAGVDGVMTFEELCKALITAGKMTQEVFDTHQAAEKKIPTAMTQWTILKSASLMANFTKEAEPPSAAGGISKWKTAILFGEMAAEVSDEPAEAPVKTTSNTWSKMKTAALMGELAAEVHDESSDAFTLQLVQNSFTVNDGENSGKTSLSLWKKATLFSEMAAESTDEKLKTGWGKVGGLMSGEKWDAEVTKMEAAKGEDDSVSLADISSMLIASGGVTQEASDAHARQEADLPTAMTSWTILKSVALMGTVAEASKPEPAATEGNTASSRWKSAGLFAELAAESSDPAPAPAAGSAVNAIKELKKSPSKPVVAPDAPADATN